MWIINGKYFGMRLGPVKRVVCSVCVQASAGESSETQVMLLCLCCSLPRCERWIVFFFPGYSDASPLVLIFLLPTKRSVA